ncbi:hypothetical protein PF002_g7593 [Phytophthora fragariae]|uniref:Uncharacterized protein n=1 Tax=Phytophthora fragariae TaxID=53985 RepID=A0A6A3ZZT7_9STRA|nr:hypothetical protein PF002_g7593 [Phytophthora fragariae]
MQLVDYTWNIRLVFSALRARGGDDRGTLRGHQSCKAQPHRDLRGFSRLKAHAIAALPVKASSSHWTKAVSVGTLLSGVLVLEGAENNGYAERFVAVR